MANDGYKHTQKQISQLESELAEFQASSRELEKELELELEESELRQAKQEEQIAELTVQVKEWKQKHLELNKEYASTQASLQHKINTLSSLHRQATNKLTEIEMTNDDMERQERIQKSSLDDMEQKYYTCLEDIAMLESEVAGKEEVEVELQRVKDELRDTREELSVANTNIVQLKKQTEEMRDKVVTDESPTATVIRTRQFRITSDPSAAMSAVTATSDSSASSSNQANMPRMASSKSLRKIHGMLDQMRNLESRVATFKSSLPQPTTPSRSPSSASASSTTTPSPNNGSSPSNLPVSSSRRNSSLLFIDRALHEKARTTEYSLRKPPQTKFGLDPIEGSPTTVNSSSRDMRKKPSVEKSASNQDVRNVKRPGSAFSALHARTGIGHGRFV